MPSTFSSPKSPWPRRVAAVAVAGVGISSLLGGAPALAQGSTPVSSASARAGDASRDWFSDPRTPAQRRAEIDVPANPAAYSGRLRETTAVYRTRAGGVAVPVTWAYGHDLQSRQAVVLDDHGLFDFNSAQATRSTRQQIRRLAASLDYVSAVTCEGYADYAGLPANEQRLSRARAREICDLLDDQRPGIDTRVVGFGGDVPAVVGGDADARDKNRRVVITVTDSRPIVVAPDAPTQLRVRAGNRSLGLSFDAPAGRGASALTGFQVSLDGGRTWQRLSVDDGDPSTATVRHLENGTTYRVAVRAVNSAGAGEASSVLRATPVAPVAVPGAPTLLSAEGGEYSVTITFSAPERDGGSAVTAYEASRDGGATWSRISVSGSGPLTKTWSDVAPENVWALRVRALNDAGHSAASNLLTAMAFGRPSAPAIGETWGDDGSVHVSFSAPDHDGGKPVTGYQASVDGGDTWVDVDTLGDGPWTASFDGLTNGHFYTVQVRASNLYGPGDVDQTFVLAATTPAAPALSLVTPLDGSADVVLDVPSDDGGSPVTGYEVSTDEGDTWQELVVVTVDGHLAGHLTGLANGTTYGVRVRALSDLGHGPASETLTVVPRTVPSVPVWEDATGGVLSADLSFSAPESDGGSEVTGYQYSVDGGDWADLDVTPGTPLTAVVTGLAVGGHDVSLRAVNAAGHSAATDPRHVTALRVLTVPGVPTLAEPTLLDSAADVVFTAPEDDGGSEILRYEFTDGEHVGTLVLDVVDGVRTGHVTGLTPGHVYNLRFRAVNAIGDGDWSEGREVTAVTVPGAPSLGAPTLLDGGADLALTAPGSDGGSEITGYEVSTDGGDHWTSATGPTLHLRDLTNGHAYDVRVRAVNGVGAGAASTTRSVTPRTVPGTPTVAEVTGGSLQATLSFTAPSDNGGSEITGYEYSTDGDTWHALTVTGTTSLSAVVSGLGVGGYDVAIRAVNAAGAGAATSASHVTVTAPAAPNAPMLNSADEWFNEIEVWFTAPAANGAAVTGYQIELNGSGTWTDLNLYDQGNGSWYGWFPYTNYMTPGDTVRVRAVSNGTPGDPSNSVFAYNYWW